VSNDYTLKAPLLKWYFSWGGPPHTLNPLWARFATTEAEFPTLLGDGIHRVYLASYCKSELLKGYMHYYAGGDSLGAETGFAYKEHVFGWLDKSDGYFKMKVPVGALPLEPCRLSYSNLFAGTKYGVRRVSSRWGTNMPPVHIIPPFGAVYDDDYGGFLWAATGDNGFSNGGRYTFTDQEITGYDQQGRPMYRLGAVSLTLDELHKMMWVSKVTGTGYDTVTNIETWSIEGNYDGGAKVLTRRYTQEPAVEVVESIRKSDGRKFPGVLGTVVSPWRSVGGHQARHVVYRVANTSYLAWQFGNGRFMTVGGYNAMYFYPIDDVYINSGGARRVIYGPTPGDEYYTSNGMDVTGTIWEITPQQMHSACTYLQHRAFRDQIILRAYEIISEEVAYCRKIWVVRRNDGSLIGSWDPPENESHDIVMISGSPFVERVDPDGQKYVMNIFTGGKVYWRNTYRWNGFPGNLGLDDQHGWEGGYSSISHVFYGKCHLLGDPGDPYMIIHESGFFDTSGGCQAGSYRGEAKYVITTLADKDPVPNATVECRIVGETIGTNAQVHFDQTFTGYTNSVGEVWFNVSSCIAGAEPFLLSFSVLNVTVSEKTYLPASNTEPATVFKQWGEEAPPPDALTPDPSEFHSSSPFQVFQSATYWHCMAAAAVTTVPANEPVEYKFTCVDNGLLTSTWRNADNVAGKFFPNGQPQTPQQYWVQVGIKNLLYRWKVQYRFKNNPSVIAAESPQKQITNTLP
jgi:hypothetical protein